MGKIINSRYEIQRQLGKGGMGEVFLAWDNQENKYVAVKFILVRKEEEKRDESAKDRREREADNRTREQRFVKEAGIMMGIRHPNVVACTDVGLYEGSTYFLVMEHVDGNTLTEEIERNGKRLSWDITREYVMKICNALAAAHERSVMHRDIKPGNIMLTKEKEIKVMDFGLAKSESDEGKDLTREGLAVGTIAYMAPEQVKRGFDKRVDIYAVGVLMYRMLTGTLPITADDVLPEQRDITIINRKMHEKPPRPTEKVPGLNIPPYVEEIVMKALEIDPNDRFQTMNELKEAIIERRSQAIDLGEQIIRDSIRMPPMEASPTPVFGMPAMQEPPVFEQQSSGGFGRFLKWATILGAIGGTVALGIHHKERISGFLRGTTSPATKPEPSPSERKKTFTARIETVPRGADVYEVTRKGLRKLGNTRNALRLEFDEPTRLLIKKSGYWNKRVRVSQKKTRIRVRLTKRRSAPKAAPARPPIIMDNTEITTE
jgi:serine/threonine protein kinase